MRPPAYRADIDGLRALAVAMVIAYHARPAAFPSGFIGVDVFFVISGFLITRVILGSAGAGAFTLREFYARRIRRLFPSLLVVLAACLAAGWALLLPPDYAQLGRHVAGGAAFSSNVVLWSEAGYFDRAAFAKPLLHLWSLAIEEQFYLLWPLTLLWLRRRGHAFSGAATLALISLAFGIYLAITDPPAAFFSPLPRWWELMIGCVLAQTSIPESRTAGREWWAALGFAALTAAFLVTAIYPFPGAWALLPTTGAALLIAAGGSTWINRRILAHPVLAGIGLVSYPLYLWHWPALVYLRAISSSPPTALVTAGVVLGSVFAAWLTYRAIELPIRQRPPSPTTTVVLCALLVLVGASGLLINARAGVPERFPEPLRDLVNYRYDVRDGARYDECWVVNQPAYTPFAPACTDRSDGKTRVAIWGDSYAGRLYPGVRSAGGSVLGVSDYARDSCPPLVDFGTPTCRRSTDEVLAQIAAMPPRAVILFARWHIYDATYAPDRPAAQKLLGAISALIAAGVPRVIVVGPAPEWPRDLPRVLYDQARADVPHYRIPNRLDSELTSPIGQTDAGLRRLLEGQPNVRFVSLFELLCDASGCLTHVPGAPADLISWDYGHLTTPAAALVGRRLLELRAFD